MAADQLVLNNPTGVTVVATSGGTEIVVAPIELSQASMASVQFDGDYSGNFTLKVRARENANSPWVDFIEVASPARDRTAWSRWYQIPQEAMSPTAEVQALAIGNNSVTTRYINILSL